MRLKAARASNLRLVFGRRGSMRLIKRIAISVGALLALALAGGAHYKL